MYMPGRSRTGSRPSRTEMSFAVYEASGIKKALQVAPFRAAPSVSDRAAVTDAREAHPRSFFYRFAEFFGLDAQRQLLGLPHLLRGRLRRRLATGLRSGRLRLRQGARREAQASRRGLTERFRVAARDSSIEVPHIAPPPLQ